MIHKQPNGYYTVKNTRQGNSQVKKKSLNRILLYNKEMLKKQIMCAFIRVDKGITKYLTQNQ